MVQVKLLFVAFLSALVIWCPKLTGQIPNAEAPSWVTDLRTLGYPTHPTESFSRTFGVPPTKLAFADPKHLVVTFISSDPSTSEREGRPDSFRLRLHVIVFESRTGKVDTKRDSSTPNPNDGVVAAHDGKVVVRAGDLLTLYDTTLEALKETDTASNHGPNARLFTVLSSPTGRFLLLEFIRSGETEYSWMSADDLETIHSFSDRLFPLAISDKEIGGWRRINPREVEFVIRKPDSTGRAIPLPNYRSNALTFVNQHAFVIEAGYFPMPLIRADGTIIETITHPSHDFFSRVTPSAEGQRFAFTRSRILNVWEILSPHQQWEYVQRVNVYDMPTHTFVCDVKVRHSAKNSNFPLALSQDRSMLGFLDGESLKVYRLPLATEQHP